MRRLQEQGVRVFAITNFNQDKFAECQQRFDFLNSFEGIIVSGLDKVLKPEAAIFELLCTRYGLQLSDCLFIDDSAKNVAGAQAAGMHAVLFTHPDQLEVDLRGHGLLV
jgi:2-haloacid dehalogenase